MGENWNPEDFKHNMERSSNAGDATVVLLRHLTSSLSSSSPIYTRPANAQGEPQSIYSSPYGESYISFRTLILQTRSLFGLSALRDVTGSISGAVIRQNANTSEFEVETSNSPFSLGYVETAEHCTTVADMETIVLCGTRVQENPVGEQVFKWGLFDDQNGFYFGKDVTGSFVAINKSGSIVKQIYQTDWNIDKLDGSGSSKYDLEANLGSGHIYGVRFLWHGYGFIEWTISTFNEKNLQVDAVVHRERVTGSVSVLSPHVGVRVQVENGNTAQSASLFSTCRSAHVVGNFETDFRLTSERVINKSIGTSFVPIVSLKRRGALFDRANVTLGSISILSDANLIWEVRSNAILSGANFGPVSTREEAETTLESDTSAISAVSGNYIVSGLAEGDAGSKASVSSIDLPKQDFVLDYPMTLMARSVGGAATITAILEVREEW